jgi:uncharacterized membrane protein YczE
MEVAMSMQPAMDNVTIPWIQLLLSCVVCAIIVAWYVWPYLPRLLPVSMLDAVLTKQMELTKP